MHIPDGFLDTKTWVSFGTISIGFIGVAIKKVKEDLKEKSIPLMEILGAFIFATSSNDGGQI